MSSFDKSGLSVALNEATLLGLEVDAANRRAAATFAVLTLPPLGPAPVDARVQMIFEGLGRVAASLRNGRWDDPKAQVEPFLLEQLLETVQSFQGLPIYGWEFFDCEEKTFSSLSDRLSLDVEFRPDGRTHSITLFQEGNDRHLDIWLWFDRLAIYNPVGSEIPIAEFVAGGKRWWDALYQGDDRTSGHGIIPLT